jgi:hypothetical protein
MPISKLQEMGEGSAAVVVPKEYLRDMDMVREDGQIRDGYARIDRDGERDISIEVFEE